MNPTLAFRIAAVVGFAAVALGAFGAHGLKDLLEKNGTLDAWKTGSLYHLIHAVVLLVLASRAQLNSPAWFCFLAGTFIFSGSLYLLAVTGIKWLGAITPIGGLCLLAGWLILILRGR